LEKKRIWIPRMENKRVWRPRMENKRVWKKGWRTKEFGDKEADNERVEIWRAEHECRVQKGITKLHRTLDSAVNFGLGEKLPHLGSEAAHRRGTSITGTSGTAAVGRTSVGSGT